MRKKRRKERNVEGASTQTCEINPLARGAAQPGWKSHLVLLSSRLAKYLLTHTVAK